MADPPPHIEELLQKFAGHNPRPYRTEALPEGTWRWVLVGHTFLATAHENTPDGAAVLHMHRGLLHVMATPNGLWTLDYLDGRVFRTGPTNAEAIGLDVLGRLRELERN